MTVQTTIVQKPFYRNLVALGHVRSQLTASSTRAIDKYFAAKCVLEDAQLLVAQPDTNLQTGTAMGWIMLTGHSTPATPIAVKIDAYRKP